MNIRMDPDGVSATGQAMADIADAARERTKSLLDSCETAAQANPGWSAGAALVGCRTAWRDQTGKLIDRTVEVADALRASAGDASAMDAEARDRLDHVMH